MSETDVTSPPPCLQGALPPRDTERVQNKDVWVDPSFCQRLGRTFLTLEKHLKVIIHPEGRAPFRVSFSSQPEPVLTHLRVSPLRRVHESDWLVNMPVEHSLNSN